MKRVLLTGATGFIGRHCLPALAQIAPLCGGEIHAVSSASSTNWEMPGREVPGVIRHRVDLLQGEAGARLIEEVQPTHWLHLAWSAAPGKWAEAPVNFDWVRITLEMLRAFAPCGGQRVVMAGSCAEYDWRYGLCSELTPLVPATAYGTCKLALGRMLQAFALTSGLSAAWGRAFFLYGPGENPQRLVASVARSLLRGEEALCSSGEQMRDFLHAQDVADAFVALLRSDVEGNFNIGSGQAVAVKDVVKKIAAQAGREDLVRLGALPGAENEAPLVFADVRRLKQELGWQPRFSLDQGLAHTLDWWREHEAQQDG